MYPDSFPAESTCVSFCSAQCELCGCCCSQKRVLCESCPAHQVLVVLSLVTRQLILCTRLCVVDSRHGMHHSSRKSHVSIWSRSKTEIFVPVVVPGLSSSSSASSSPSPARPRSDDTHAQASGNRGDPLKKRVNILQQSSNEQSIARSPRVVRGVHR